MSETIKWLSKEEYNHFISVIDNKRDSVMFQLMYFYGLRRVEASWLKAGSLDLENRFESKLRIKAAKNGVSGMYALLPSISKMLLDYVEEFEIEDDSPLFRSKKGGHLSPTQIGRIFKKYAIKAGLKPELQHVHVLRHSIAIHLANAGRTAEEVQMHLRHKDIGSTMKYYRITDERRDKVQINMLNSLQLRLNN